MYIGLFVCFDCYFMHHIISTVTLIRSDTHNTPFRTVTPVCPHSVPVCVHFMEENVVLRQAVSADVGFYSLRP